LAGSKNQSKNKTSYKKNPEKNAAKGKAKSNRKSNEPEEVSYRTEIIVWIICAVMLILELGNFGLCGFINHISWFFFGIFGII